MTKPGVALTCGMGKGAEDRSGGSFPARLSYLSHSRVWIWIDANTPDSCKGSRLLDGSGPNGLLTPLQPASPPFEAPASRLPPLEKHCGDLGGGGKGVSRTCQPARLVRARPHARPTRCLRKGAARRGNGEISAPAPALLAGVFQTTVRPGAVPPTAALTGDAGGRPTPLGHKGDRARQPSGGLSLSSSAPPGARLGALRVDGLPRVRTPAPLLSTGLWWRVVPPVP